VLACALGLRGDSGGLPGAAPVVAFVRQSIDWNRGVATLEQVVSDPADTLFFNDSRQISRQALQLSFDYARAYAQYLDQQQPARAEAPLASSSQQQSLMQMAAGADQEAADRDRQLQALRRRLAASRGRARARLQGQVAALESEIQLEKTRADTLRSLVQFAGGAATTGSLQAQINELQRSVLSLQPGAHAAQPAAASAPTSSAVRAQPSGIIAIVERLLALGRKSNTLQAQRRATDTLAQAAEQLRAPMVAQLTAIAAQGDKAVEQAVPAGDYGQRKQQLDSLTAQFKQLSAAVLPLGKQSILLDSYRANLDRWRASVSGEYQTALKALVVRLIVLALVLFVVFALAVIYRKAVFHYVHDLRRRYQLLLIRRIILWIAIALAIAFALASEIGSLATFVGLITAGIAVALQNVILAIAGYFFLIGKYGVRVGDRVQIASVSGVVVDIGLIRLHLMELGAPEAGRQPTGRVVVFSNAVVFQAGASFFKQIPGTSFTWHEITLTLAPETDYQVAEKRMLRAVEAVYERYRERMERQHRAMQENLNLEVALPQPHTRLRLTAAGLEVVIRFPTELENSAEMDDAVARELLRAIEQAPRLRLVGSGTPTLQPVPEKPPAPPQTKSA
jgi:small-conductance mechanosensitive channel